MRARVRLVSALVLFFLALTACEIQDQQPPEILSETNPCFIFPPDTNWYIGPRGYHNGCEDWNRDGQPDCTPSRPITGWDYIAPEGIPILSPFDGRVAEIFTDGLGNPILVIRNNRYEIGLMHLAITVSTGQDVKKGGQIGKNASEGNSTEPHAHVWFLDLESGQNIRDHDQFWACIVPPPGGTPRPTPEPQPTPVPEPEPVWDRLNWPVIILIFGIIFLVSYITWKVFRKQQQGLILEWEHKYTVQDALADAFRDSLNLWLLIVAVAVVISKELTELIRLGFLEWVEKETTLANWQIAVIFFAFVLHFMWRYWRKTKDATMVLLTTILAVGFTLSLGLIAVIGAPSVFATVTPTSPPTRETPPPPIGDCDVSAEYPFGVFRWCELITRYSHNRGLDPNLVAAIVLVESGGNPNARSRCDAIGLMQIMPRDLTEKTIACGALSCPNGHCFADRPTIQELFDPETNILWGTKILDGYIRYTGSIREGLKRYGPSGVGYEYADLVIATWNKYKN